MSLEIESAYISSLRSIHDYGEAQRRGIEPATFAHHAQVWQMLSGYAEAYGELPTPAMLAEVGFAVQEAVGAPGYWLEQLQTVFLERSARAFMVKAAEELNKGTSPLGIIEELNSRLSALRMKTTGNVSYLDADARARQKQYEAMRAAQAGGEVVFSGIPTGLEPLDLTGVGWLPRTLSAIIGMPSTGKSELLIRSMVEAWATGHRVLFVSPEMSEAAVGYRTDVLLATRFGLSVGTVNGMPGNSELMTGRGTEQQLISYSAYMDFLTKRSDLMILDQSGSLDRFTVGTIRSLAFQHRADIVIIDGFKYLSPANTRAASEWEKHKALFEDLRNLAQADGFCVLVAEHTNNAVKNVADEPMPHQSYMGNHVNQGCERVLTIWNTRNAPGTRYIAMRKNRSGEPIDRSKQISYDVERGDVGRWVESWERKADSELARYLGVESTESKPVSVGLFE